MDAIIDDLVTKYITGAPLHFYKNGKSEDVKGKKKDPEFHKSLCALISSTLERDKKVTFRMPYNRKGDSTVTKDDVNALGELDDAIESEIDSILLKFPDAAYSTGVMMDLNTETFLVYLGYVNMFTNSGYVVPWRKRGFDLHPESSKIAAEWVSINIIGQRDDKWIERIVKKIDDYWNYEARGYSYDQFLIKPHHIPSETVKKNWTVNVRLNRVIYIDDDLPQKCLWSNDETQVKKSIEKALEWWMKRLAVEKDHKFIVSLEKHLEMQLIDRGADFARLNCDYSPEGELFNIAKETLSREEWNDMPIKFIMFVNRASIDVNGEPVSSSNAVPDTQGDLITRSNTQVILALTSKRMKYGW